MSGSHLSKDFFELVKAIGESKSKQEEDRIIVQEIALLKRRLSDATYTGNTTAIRKRQKEFIIRIMYVEMLGHDASFGYIKAIELVASTNLLQKRVGYLCCSLVLSPSHEFRFMIINQLQRDLKSSNQLEVTAALTAVCKLMTVEMIPAVLPMILDLLPHDAELVRKKAMMALHRFHQLNPDSIADFGDQIRRMLCDRDPSVMGASLCILHDLVVANSVEYKDLVPSFVSILKQIMEHRLPREYDYHRIPAPWIQIRLLKILAMLGQADQTTSEGMYEILHDVMRRADTGINVGYAIIYECVMTVTTIYPNSTLLDSAAASISRFISSDNHNLKYLGVTGLAAIVKDHPRYATAHQMAVIDCLEDPDETLKRKTLDLLYRMTNPVNVEYITEKLTQFLRETSDVFLRTELVSRITQCAERYAPSNAWYIATMTDVFELGGDLVRGEVAHNLLRLIAEGSGSDELEEDTSGSGKPNDAQDMELRKDAVETYVELLDRAQGNVPDILVCVMSWVLGEYGYLSELVDLDELCERLCELAERSFQNQDETRSYVLTAVIKITAQLGRLLPVVHQLLTKYSESRSTDIQQRCFECLSLTTSPHNFAYMAQVLPVDASCQEFELDPNMEFLDAYVQHAIETRGASRYCPPPEEELYPSTVTFSDSNNVALDHSDHVMTGHHASSEAKAGLNFSAYEKPELPHYIPKRVEALDLQHSAVPGYGGGPSPGKAGPWGPAPPSVMIPQQPSSDSYPGHPAPATAATSGYATGSSNPPAVTGGVKSVWGPSGFNQPTLNQPGPGPQQYGQQPGPGLQQYGQQPGPGLQQYGQQPGPGPQPGYPMENAQSYEVEEDMDTTVVPDERQAMASALFGGLPGVQKKVAAPSSRRSGTSRSSTSKKSSRNTTHLPQSGQSRPATQPPAVDLLDFGSPTIAPAAAPAPVTSISSDPFKLSSPHVPVVDPFLSMTAGPSGIGSALPNPAFSTAVPITSSPSLPTMSLSPWKITTPEFGSRWGSCKCEKKDKVQPTNIRSLNDYQLVVPRVNLHLVEAIPQTNEAIAAGIIGNDLSKICLVHAKIRSAGFLELTVRTADPALSESVFQILSTSFR